MISIDAHRPQLELYEATLRRWQKSINLVSPSTLDTFWERHVMDSAQLLSFVDPTGPIGDLGSGAGFPGLVLAILGATEVHLIESDLRKGLFLEEVMRETRVRATLHRTRLEHMAPDVFGEAVPLTWTARAFAPIGQLLQWSWALQKPETRYVLLKGEKVQEEIDEALKKWVFRVEKHPSLTHAGGCIVVLSDVILR